MLRKKVIQTVGVKDIIACFNCLFRDRFFQIMYIGCFKFEFYISSENINESFV